MYLDTVYIDLCAAREQQQRHGKTKKAERMSAEGTKHGADCLVRDAQRVSSLSATETFDGVDGGYLNSPGSPGSLSRSLARSLAHMHTRSLVIKA